MQVKKIDSSTNGLYKKLASLARSKGIIEHGQCLVAGEKIVAELASEATDSAFWIFTSDDHELFDQYPLGQVIVLPKNLFAEIDVIGTRTPVLCMDVPPIEEWTNTATLKENELLCALGDPNNLGALLRSARAFGIKNVVLLEEACHPFHPKAIKASSGACFYLNFFKGPSIQNLDGVKNILALDGEGEDIKNVELKEKFRILLGEEGQGIPENLEAQKISIQIDPEVESLNATVAASILLYEISKT